MLQHDRVAKLVAWFVKAALRHAEAMAAMDEAGAAAEVADLDRYYAALQREGGVQELLVMLEHDDPHVSGMVAVYAMRVAPERCSATLKRVARLPGLIGFRAQAALERWEKGEWPE